jgi:predicted HicB family RNase H-like nuclease
MPQPETVETQASKVLFIRVPRSVHLAVRKEALDRDVTVSELVAGWVRQQLDKQPREAA